MGYTITRRDFVKTSIGLAAATRVAGAGGMFRVAPDTAQSPAPIEWRNKQPDMRYRKLGRTGFMISEIVCGGDPIAPTNFRHVVTAFEMGLNYFDTAAAYGDGQSEMGYARAIQQVGRQNVFVNTKISPFTEARYQVYRKTFESLNRDEQAAILREVSEDITRRHIMVPNYFGNYFNGQIRQAEEAALANVMEKRFGNKIDRRQTYAETIIQSLEASLKRLNTDHVDLMMCPHGATSASEVQIPEIYEAFEQLRKQGKVRFLGVSAHTDPAGVLKAAMETGVYSMAMVAYNIINRQYVEPVIAEAHGRDFGVIAMKAAQAVFQPDRSPEPVPERAALLDKSVPGEKGLHQKAYRFALSNTHLSAVISNMVDEKQVRENLAAART